MAKEYSTSTMKHAKKVALGDTIKAYQTKPKYDIYNRPSSVQSFIIGRVVGLTNGGFRGIADKDDAVTNRIPFRYQSYDVVIIATSHGQFDIDETVFVPYEIQDDFGQRVEDWTEKHQKCFGDHAVREEVAYTIEYQKQNFGEAI